MSLAPGQRVIDVSHLPEHAWDSHEPTWWGNMFMIFIESTTILLLVATYFYIKRNFDSWPPPKVDVIPPLFKPGVTPVPGAQSNLPDLWAGTANLILMCIGVVTNYITDIKVRKLDSKAARIGLGLLFFIAIGTCGLRYFEFKAIKFHWTDNAYGSIVWIILGTHATYLIGAAAEYFIMEMWNLTHEIDLPHALDLTLAGGYWYWATGMYALVYAVVYFAPRIL